MKLNKEIYITITFGIAILALLLFAAFPLYSSINKLQIEIEDEKITLAQQKQQNTDLAALNRQYQQIQENASSLDEAFLKKDTISILQFIEDIESLSSSIALDEQFTIAPLPQSEDDPIRISEVTLIAEGSFTNIYRFLEAIEKKPFYMTFTEFDMTLSGEKIYTATLRGSVHWQ